MRHDQTKSAAALLALILLVGIGTLPSTAHEGATGVVAERMAAMKSMGDAMKGLAAMLRGEAPYDDYAVRHAAEAIGRHGGEDLTSLFPDGSLHGPSEALPSIWQDWDEFARLADELTVHAASLAEATNGSPQTGPTFRRSFVQLGRVCSACHTDFREDD